LRLQNRSDTERGHQWKCESMMCMAKIPGRSCPKDNVPMPKFARLRDGGLGGLLNPLQPSISLEGRVAGVHKPALRLPAGTGAGLWIAR
jgi:hypothetical protein